MNTGLGRIKAHLTEPSEDKMSQLVQLINSNINPPGPVGEGEVYIRAMYIASDEVNSFGGRFPSDELGHLAELLIDSPVMVGHRKDRLPVARTFHAKLVNRDGKSWVKSYFYWLRSATGADDILHNIDAGIYKECSIGFTYMFPECSICGKDIRVCRHEPFEQYQTGEEKRSCHFNYRQIERVLESSLVYRGAVADTGMSKELSVTNDGNQADEIRIESPAELALDVTYLVVPFYESIPVKVSVENGRLRLEDVCGNELPANIVRTLGCPQMCEIDGARGQLIGYRGKERCTVDQLKSYLSGQSSPVTHIELKLLPDDDTVIDIANNSSRVSVIRHKFCRPSSLNEISQKLKTRHGVRLWAADRLGPTDAGYVYMPDKKSTSPTGYYRFCLSSGANDVRLELCLGESVNSYRLKQFHLPRFNKGCRFIADRISDTVGAGMTKFDRIVCGEVLSARVNDNALALELDGPLAGPMFIQPIELNGARRHLVYRRELTSDVTEE